MTIDPPIPSHVLITGGSSGIGLGLARRYLLAGARVMVTGRDRGRLRDAADRLPGLLVHAGDLAQPSARERLAADARERLPNLSVLVNNAGVQRRVSIAADAAPWPERQAELDILLAAPMHLCSLLVPLLLQQDHPGTIVNVSSGGAFIPQPFAPAYSACKAALHSYTVTLRHALAETELMVKELIPPAVATGLAGPSASHGADPDVFCDAVFPALLDRDSIEIGYGPTAGEALTAPRALLEKLFASSSSRFPIERFARAMPHG